MSETNKYEGHTPGKWRRASKYNFGTIVGPCKDAGGLAMVFGIPGNCDFDSYADDPRYAEGLANAALIADAPELLRQRDALLAALKLISKMAPREDPGGDYEYDTGNPSDHFRAGLILGYYECAKLARDTIEAIAATKGGA